MLLKKSWSLSIRLFPMVHIITPSSLCKVLCIGFVGNCFSSYPFVGWVPRSRCMGVVENVRFGDLHPSLVYEFSGGCVVLFF